MVTYQKRSLSSYLSGAGAALALVTLLAPGGAADPGQQAGPGASKASKTSSKTKKTTGKAGVPARQAETMSNPVGDNTPLTEEQKIAHVLNRMGFGPRPGDVEKVKAMGLDRYIALQLAPEKITDSAVEAKLAPLSLLKTSPQEMAEMYRMRQKKTPMLLAAQKKLQDTDNRREAMQSLTDTEREAIQTAQEAQQSIRRLGFQLVMDKTVRAVESERQFQEVMVDFWSNHFNIDMRKNACAVYKPADEYQVIRPHVFGRFRDLLGASAKSPAMLVYLDNAQSFAPLPDNPRQEQARQRMLRRAAEAGNEDAQMALMAMRNRGKGGINENYAREIMELHTLGVDGGYTQKDVQEVARCLTGWSVNRRNGTFNFVALRHDRGEKTVLGEKIPAGGGMEDGEKVLDLLARHPSTMRYLSTKLCKRLVSDEPPASLVEKCVSAWKRTDGDLREVYRTIVTSPEFLSRAAYRKKIKSPFEYAVSSVRALGGSIELPEELTEKGRRGAVGISLKARGLNNRLGQSLAGQVATMGQPLFQYQAPTGYPEDSQKWVSSGALISRLNFSLALVGGRLGDVDITRATELGAGVTDHALLVDRLGEVLLQGEMSPSTRATLLKQVGTTPKKADAAATETPARLAALVLGSPEFQRR